MKIIYLFTKLLILLAGVWHNIFYGDWWAGLLIFSGFILWFRKQHLWAAIMLLIAALFREVTLAFLLFFTIISFFGERKAIKYYVTPLIIFLAVYSFHYVQAKNFISKSFLDSGYGFSSLYPVAMIGKITGSSTPKSVVSYLLFPYGLFQINSLYLVAGSFISAWILRSKQLSLFFAFVILYFINANSSYWGQHLMLIILSLLIFVILYPVFDNNDKLLIKNTIK